MSAASLPTPRVDVIPERWALIDQIRLSSGAHNRPSGNDLPTGMCVMEFDSWLTGGWGDRPECVSPVLWPVFQRLNDRLQDEPRQALLLYGIRALGTAGDGLDEQRRAVAWAAVPDMLVPWLRLAGLDEEADAVLTAGDVAALRTACRAAYDAARTARLAARARLHKRVEKRMRKELEKRLDALAAEAAVAALADWAAVDNLMNLQMKHAKSFTPEMLATYRSRFAAGHGSVPLYGTPDQVADEIERYWKAGFGGLTLAFVDYIGELEYFAAEVLPRLEKKGARTPR